MKPIALLSVVLVALLSSTGCQFTMTDGYVFDYSGVQASKQTSAILQEGLESVELQNKFGNVQVSHDSTRPFGYEWEAIVWGSDSDLADQFLGEMQLLETVEDNRCVVTVVLPEHDQDLNGIKSNLTVNLPRSVQLKSVNSHGSTRVTQMTSSVDVKNSHGDSWLQNVGQARVETRHGDLTVENALELLDVVARHGDVTLTNVHDVIADGSHSDFRVRNQIGKGDFTSSHGDIAVNGGQGNLTLVSQHGDLVATNISGNVKAETSFGEILVEGDSRNLDLKNKHGEVRAVTTSSSIEAITIKTSFDDIKLTLPADARVQLKGDGQEYAGKFSNQAGDAVVQLDIQHGEVSVAASK